MKAEDIAKKAESFIGRSRNQVNCGGTHAWCANFVSEVLKQCGIGMYDLSCTSMQKRMSASDDWGEPDDDPRRGDVLFFDWDHIAEAKPLDHVGIITAFDGKIITYVNGNGNSSEFVTRQTIPYTSGSIAYWMRFVGDISEPPDAKEETESGNFTIALRTLKKGMKGNDVKALQRLLFSDGYGIGAAGDDGDFGKCTEKAVCEYQRVHKLEVDGIAGKQTFSELLKS